MKRQIFSFLFVLSFLLSACAPFIPGGAGTAATPLPTDVTSPPGPTMPVVPTQAAPTASPTSIPQPSATPTRILVDQTPAQRAAIRVVSEKYKLPVDQIHLIKTEARSFPSGCLGIVLPGVMCAKGPVDGFVVTLEANQRQFEVHTNLDGTSAIDAAQQLATIQLVVASSNHSVQLMSPNLPLGPTYNPAFSGLLSSGAAVAGTAYVLDYNQTARVVALDRNGSHELGFIKNPTYGLALWRGGPNTAPRLAWGSQLIGAQPSTLQISALDGTHLETVFSLEAAANLPQQLVAEFWSADGQTLYFSKEPVGLGGYIPFAGASNLFKIDIASKQVSEVTSKSSFTCLDAVSGDYRYVADHCSLKAITVTDLSGKGAASTIQPPAEVKEFRLLGSARFSPDGSRLAYALAKGDPQNEQGWVAVSNGRSGASKLILTSQPGAYYNVIGWLDDQTLLVQLNTNNCTMSCSPQLWTVDVEQPNPQKVADGSFLTVIDNR